VRQCERRCVAGHLVVYGSALGSVRLSGSVAVCGGVRDSVRQCALLCMAMRAAVCGCLPVRQCVAVRQCAAVCGIAALCVRQCGIACVSVRQCGVVRQCVAVRAAVCGNSRGSVWQCVAVGAAVCGSSLYVCTHKVAHVIYRYTLIDKAAVGLSSKFPPYQY
jgi:hypothetical protein